MTEWRDISTAPRDGTYILVHGEQFDGGCAVVCWDEWNWMLDNGKDFEIPLRGDQPSWWMPLPDPPEVQTNE